ncbi:MAG: dihydroorotase [Bacteroidota bacterium]|nr:dihydroorotase [Bacteroidota bacterium]
MFVYLKNATITSPFLRGFRGQKKNILIEDQFIKEVSDRDISLQEGTEIIDCEGLFVLPGIIDAHVHFRQPGAEYKADMLSESKAALVGGVTTVFDMPNNNPPIVSKNLLDEKLTLCKDNMLCNYALYLGLTNDNIEEAIKTDQDKVIGLKLFLGSSTGNMLVNKKESIVKLFKESPFIVTAHCEDEQRIKDNTLKYKELEDLPYNIHSLIRDEKVCYDSSAYAIELAKQYGTQFHLAHISTGKEVALLSNKKLEEKNISAEVSPNHLFFSQEDYLHFGNLMKCNPAIKTAEDKHILRQALKEGFIDIVATDHAPHLLEEKKQNYFQTPSGIPSIQFSLLMMLQIAKQENWDISLITEKMAENPAKRFNVKKRGSIKEGYFADLVFVRLGQKHRVEKKDLLSKCKWSLLEGYTFDNSVVMTMLNGKIVAKEGKVFADNCSSMQV